MLKSIAKELIVIERMFAKSDASLAKHDAINNAHDISKSLEHTKRKVFAYLSGAGIKKTRRVLARIRHVLLYCIDQSSAIFCTVAINEEMDSRVLPESVRAVLAFLCDLEERYRNILTDDDRVSYLTIEQFRISVKEQLSVLSKHLPELSSGWQLAEDYFLCNGIKPYVIDFGALRQREILLDRLVQLCQVGVPSNFLSEIDTLLIMINLPDISYRLNVLERVEKYANMLDTDLQRGECLQLLARISEHARITQAYGDHDSLIEVIIRYIHRKWNPSTSRGNGETSDLTTSSSSSPTVSKITCQLTADQLALLLRAVDEVRIVEARSMSQVFKSIVPYLSTPFRRDLSPESLRSKSYSPEEPDRDRVLTFLEKMIARISSY